jgi:hypothetical protein
VSNNDSILINNKVNASLLITNLNLNFIPLADYVVPNSENLSSTSIYKFHLPYLLNMH